MAKRISRVSEKPDDREERRLASEGFRTIVGIDEVGRGALAGPVVAAAVVLPDQHDFCGRVNDSKALSATMRTALASELRERAVVWAVAAVSPGEIDCINIREATFVAMRQAVAGLAASMVSSPIICLVDGNADPSLDVASELLVGGDRRSVSIAAASIIAKVERDAFMTELATSVPSYGFERNKGYGTQEHRDAIATVGPSVHHRTSFLGRILQGQLEFVDREGR